MEVRRFVPFQRSAKVEAKQESGKPIQELPKYADNSIGSLPSTTGVIFDKRPPEQVYDESYVLRNEIP